ncbi:copper chaperone CopZ [Staphylococcus hominis]
MLKSNTIFVDNIETDEQAKILKERLLNMIGVNTVLIDRERNSVNIEYETPTNLNSIEKEIYDDGFKVLS